MADDRPIAPAARDLARATETRYADLARSGGSLSCGGALDLAAPAPGEVLIDLGCGRGGDVVKAARAVAPGGTAIGVDASPDMLAASRERATGLSNTLFLPGALDSVPLPDGCADVVTSNCAINHAPDKVAVYREVFRLLRPGGRFVVSDVASEAPLPAEVRAEPAAWAACYGGAIPVDEVLGAIREAGFHEVEVLERSAPYPKGGVEVLRITVAGRR